MLNYLTSRKKELKMVPLNTIGRKFLEGISQGYILGPLFFNIITNDIFFFVEKSKVCNFAVDKTIYSCGKHLLQLNKT